VLEATELFRELTGMTAVVSFGSPEHHSGSVRSITPPVHPRCAALLRKATQDAPCKEEWHKHLRSGHRTRSAQRHTCPLSMRCSCVPIYNGDALVGVAKCVAGPKMASRRFTRAVRLLELTLAKAVQEFRASVLSDEVESLQERLAQLLHVRQSRSPAAFERPEQHHERTSRSDVAAGRSLVDRALEYISGHFSEQALSLNRISRAVGTNEKYLSHLFTSVIGQHMHEYISRLRVQHACHLILSTDKSTKLVAYESGFNRADGFGRTFRRYVGVSPRVYRRVFVSG